MVSDCSVASRGEMNCCGQELVWFKSISHSSLYVLALHTNAHFAPFFGYVEEEEGEEEEEGKGLSVDGFLNIGIVSTHMPAFCLCTDEEKDNYEGYEEEDEGKWSNFHSSRKANIPRTLFADSIL